MVYYNCSRADRSEYEYLFEINIDKRTNVRYIIYKSIEQTFTRTFVYNKEDLFMRTHDTAYFIHRNLKSILGGIILLLVLGILILGVFNINSKASNYNQKYFKCIDICYEDTLWTIAEEYMTEEYKSVNDYIEEVKSINGLTSDKIYSGATLVVPYYAAPM